MIGTLTGDLQDVCTDLRGEDWENQYEILQELVSDCQDLHPERKRPVICRGVGIQRKRREGKVQPGRMLAG